MLIHTGNCIQGGDPSMGIKEKDIMRQFRLFSRSLSLLKPIAYQVAGIKDLYNNDPTLYINHTGKGLNYSFNYGNIHFIVFNTLETADSKYSSDNSLFWLTKDLKRYRSRAMTIVFTHNALFTPPRGRSSHEKSEKIHDILKKHRVAAVISGDEPRYFTITKDNIQYINAGCEGFTHKNRPWKYKQYYLVTCRNNAISVQGKRLNFNNRE